MTTLKPLCGSHKKTGKFFKDENTRLSYLSPEKAVGQEATVKTWLGTMDWFKIGKGVWQGCILSLCLFNLHAQYIMWNAWLDESQVEIKIAGENINNIRYADDSTLIAESKEELKSLLMRVQEESEKAGLKLSIQKMKIMTSGPIISWQIEEETVEAVTDFAFLGSKVSTDSDCTLEIKKTLAPWKEIESVSCVQLCKPMNCSPPGHYVHGIFQQQYCSGLPFRSPGYLPNPVMESRSPALQADSLPSKPPGRKAKINLDSILKSRDITLLTKVFIVKALIFPLVMSGNES